MRSNCSQVMPRGRNVLLRMALSTALAAPFHTAWAGVLRRKSCWKDIAARLATPQAMLQPDLLGPISRLHYRGKQQADKIVAEKIRSGAHGSGPWHMPPHPEVSKADAATMARYILSTRIGSADE